MAYIRDTNEQFLQNRLPVGWPWRLLLSMGILFAVVLLVYVGLSFGYQGYLNNSIDTLNTQLDALSAKVSPTDRQNFVTFYSQIVNLEKLIHSHVIASAVYPAFEGITDQGVAYNSFDIVSATGIVTIDGTAKNYATLADQLSLYKQSPYINSAILQSSSLANNVVRFTVKITLNNASFNL